MLAIASSPLFAQEDQRTAPPQRQRAEIVADPYAKRQARPDEIPHFNDGYWEPAYQWLDPSDLVILTFKVASPLLMRDFGDNAAALSWIDEIFSDRERFGRIDHVIITGAASPEGNFAFNKQLAASRAAAVRTYIMWKFPFMDRARIFTLSVGEDWLGMRKLVAGDSRFAWRDQVLSIIDSPLDKQAKLAGIRTLDGGAAYRYMSANILPPLRAAIVCQIFYKSDAAPEPMPAPQPWPTPEEPAQQAAPAPSPQPAPEIQPAPEPLKFVDKGYYMIRKPLFAVKTNLLFDAVTAINVELEVPIGNRWSIAGEYVFPWWLNESKQYCFQTLNGTIEPRYWFGDRQKRPLMTGWFAGAHFGGGYYDFGVGKNKGWQGEFWNAGISGGYANTISRSGDWRMEYSLGLGWLGTKYRRYDPRFREIDDSWHLIRQSSGHYTWIGPTRAKISLVYLIHYNQKNWYTTREGGEQ